MTDYALLHFASCLGRKGTTLCMRDRATVSTSDSPSVTRTRTNRCLCLISCPFPKMFPPSLTPYPRPRPSGARLASRAVLHAVADGRRHCQDEAPPLAPSRCHAARRPVERPVLPRGGRLPRPVAPHGDALPETGEAPCSSALLCVAPYCESSQVSNEQQSSLRWP